MLTLKDIQHVFDALLELGLNFRFGYAGSYAKGVAKKIVIWILLLKVPENCLTTNILRFIIN